MKVSVRKCFCDLGERKDFSKKNLPNIRPQTDKFHYFKIDVFFRVKGTCL